MPCRAQLRGSVRQHFEISFWLLPVVRSSGGYWAAQHQLALGIPNILRWQQTRGSRYRSGCIYRNRHALGEHLPWGIPDHNVAHCTWHVAGASPHAGINRLVVSGLIAETSDPGNQTNRKRRLYRATDLGRSVARAELRRLQSLLETPQATGLLHG